METPSTIPALARELRLRARVHQEDAERLEEPNHRAAIHDGRVARAMAEAFETAAELTDALKQATLSAIDDLAGEASARRDFEGNTYTIGWAIVELIGHRRVAGYVTEEEVAGTAMLRVDLPMPTHDLVSVVEGIERGREMEATQFYPPGSLYCLTPTTEAIVRGFHPPRGFWAPDAEARDVRVPRCPAFHGERRCVHVSGHPGGHDFTPPDEPGGDDDEGHDVPAMGTDDHPTS